MYIEWNGDGIMKFFLFFSLNHIYRDFRQWFVFGIFISSTAYLVTRKKNLSWDWNLNFFFIIMIKFMNSFFCCASDFDVNLLCQMWNFPGNEKNKQTNNVSSKVSHFLSFHHHQKSFLITKIHNPYPHWYLKMFSLYHHHHEHHQFDDCYTMIMLWMSKTHGEW